ncbi:hypothetical protein ACIQGZ_17205 [Streptomyces sp. NPDC092296]|uniref:hypothetical protein n=1 Tax=Streptomyces sp. NPDC092296 TaxID=3366012 RepID=UPI0037FC7C4B
MTDLIWRTVRELRLTSPLVPDLSNSGKNLDLLYNVRVAIDGAFLHVDPRQEGGPDLRPGDTEFDVYVVPASSVERIHLREQKPAKKSTRVTILS